MPDLSNTAAFPFVCEGGLVLDQSTFIMKPGQALELENFEPDIEGGYRRINGFQKFVGQTVPETASSAEPVLMTTVFNNYVIAARGTNIFSSASTILTTKIASATGMTGSGTITVKSTTSFSSSGTLFIDSEQFTYTGKSATSFTGVTRAANSTTAADHSAKAVVSETWTTRDSGRTSASKYSFEKFNFDGNDKLIVVDGNNDPTVFNTSLSATDVTASSVEGA